jgi:hypothetical protein
MSKRIQFYIEYKPTRKSRKWRVGSMRSAAMTCEHFGTAKAAFEADAIKLAAQEGWSDIRVCHVSI